MLKTDSYTINSFTARGLELNWIETETFSKNPDSIILLLHGFPDNAFVWEKMLGPLGQEYKIIAPFVHGTYKEHKIEKTRYSIDSWCLDLLSLINHLDPEGKKKLFIVGHDLGGVYAKSLTEYLGKRCKAMVFINSIGLSQYISRNTNISQWLKSYYIFLFQINYLPEFIFKNFLPFSLGAIYDHGGLAKDDPIRTEKYDVFSAIEQYRQIMSRIPQAIIMKQSITEIPALFIWGEKDPFLDIPTIDEVEKFYKNYEVRVLPGSHWINRTAPEKVSQYIIKFFKKWENL